MRRASLLVTVIVVTFLATPVQALAQPGDPVLRPVDGVTDPAHPAAEEITLGDGTCGSHQTRPREVTCGCARR